MTSRDEFVESLKSNIDKWNADISKLETEMKSATAQVEARYAEQVAEASRYRAEAQAKLAETLKHSTDQWDKMRGDMEKAWGDIFTGFQNAWSRFK